MPSGKRLRQSAKTPQQLSKEVLESRYLNFLQKNSVVRKQALEKASDAKKKVPHKFQDASKR